MFEPNPNTVRYYRCDRCPQTRTVTVITPREDDDLCECGGHFTVLLSEQPKKTPTGKEEIRDRIWNL